MFKLSLFFVFIFSALQARAACNMPSPDVAIRKIQYNAETGQLVSLCSPVQGNCSIDSADTEYIYISRDGDAKGGRAFGVNSSPNFSTIKDGRADYASCHWLSDVNIDKGLQGQFGMNQDDHRRVRLIDKITRDLRDIPPGNMIIVKVIGSSSAKNRFAWELEGIVKRTNSSIQPELLPRLSRDPRNKAPAFLLPRPATTGPGRN